ncbi:hypothetical protein KSP40_PGU016666 [Platanthera guangdongensis]|uniref:Uncharacterized protein n=1 Tax=Platanthera guangdongensis TaxID=2320717 RepID=A0ABR2MTZ5_9ASPA
MGSEGPSMVTVHITGFKKFLGVAENPTETIVSNLKSYMEKKGLPKGLIIGSCSILETAGEGDGATLYKVLESALDDLADSSSTIGRHGEAGPTPSLSTKKPPPFKRKPPAEPPAPARPRPPAGPPTARSRPLARPTPARPRPPAAVGVVVVPVAVWLLADHPGRPTTIDGLPVVRSWWALLAVRSASFKRTRSSALLLQSSTLMAKRSARTTEGSALGGHVEPARSHSLVDVPLTAETAFAPVTALEGRVRQMEEQQTEMLTLL